MGQKASDWSALPLCWWDHREGPHSNHKLGKRWAAFHGLDLDAVRARYRAEFDAAR